MNLELLDPFRRQIPDRVDSTLTLPSALHKPPSKTDEKEDPEWKAAYHLAFNRRGTYLAVGHATGTVAVHDFLSRTLSAVYPHHSKEDVTEPLVKYPYGATSVSWSRRSRSLLVGAVGDPHVRLIDTTHPFGPEECCFVAPTEKEKGDNNDDGEDEPKPMRSRGSLGGGGGPNADKALIACFKIPDDQVMFHKVPRKLSIKVLECSKGTPIKVPLQDESFKNVVGRFPMVTFDFPAPIAGSLQIHPKDNTAGLAVLANGHLVLFRAPSNAWSKDLDKTEEPIVKMVKIWTEGNVTSAAFSHVGDRVFLSTKSGDFLGLDIGHAMHCLTTISKIIPAPDVLFRIAVGAMPWHLLVSHNGKHLLLNCNDSTLRLYSTEECVEKKKGIRPKTFQDVVSKEPFVCCDFSGDGEYIVGGCNGARDDKYELYLWNTATGALMDRLTGASVSLYSIAWHPTRSFLAVATSDGLVDVWGPRMDWTAFAPDFQALPMNVEYVEQEDEFDITNEPDDQETSGKEELHDKVDVVSVEPVPVFASDSESESEVFTFETKVNNMMFGRVRNRGDGKVGVDENKE